MQDETRQQIHDATSLVDATLGELEKYDSDALGGRVMTELREALALACEKLRAAQREPLAAIDVQIAAPGEIVVADRGQMLVMVLEDGETYGGLEGAQVLRMPADWGAEDIEQALAKDAGEVVATFRISSQ